MRTMFRSELKKISWHSTKFVYICQVCYTFSSRLNFKLTTNQTMACVLGQNTRDYILLFQNTTIVSIVPPAIVYIALPKIAGSMPYAVCYENNFCSEFLLSFFFSLKLS